ncbi:FAD-dependent oxidoreductase [Pseudolysinimonas kribbensis]|uniref:Ferredoxin n=1 Tax=Pseudolysinimonas kribbensis TaxID=433641 RepID=A0ABQ6K8N2_9MICO|nr:FAD-dependent oxidoreductase [Pseudolysinimonas kribbensis]GMA95898.1 ferredoxin [Pseudolysinimonas kribbensis]
MTESIVIIGGGLAAATAAEELRTAGFTGSVRLLAGEQHHPYIRPPLSKAYLTGQDDRDSVFVHPAQWYRDQDVEVSLGAHVDRIDDGRVVLAGGEEVPFDRLLIATGAVPRRLHLPGSDADGIHYLRTLDDSEALKAVLAEPGHHVVVVGSGWIGLELAAAARGAGQDVTVVAPEQVPLAGPLGTELGTMFRELHETNGVTFHLGTGVQGFEAADGHVTGVATEAGVLPADVVIVGVGVAPSTELAEAAGLDIDNGILVDEHLQTSRPGIYAAGDVANAMHPVLGARMRNEHWANAIASGKVAGRSMAGQDAVLDDIPYFYTDQYDLGMEYSGYPPLTRDAEVVIRGDRAARELIAFWVADGRVVAGMNVNIWDVNEEIQRLIRDKVSVTAAQLADPSVELSSLT